MRRKPGGSGGGYNNQQRNKPRYQGSGGGGDHRNSGHHNSGRPRKNYSAAREKYLAQARDALAAGDRVLAENYFQHADHCYRMMVEEGYHVRNNYNPAQQQPQQDEQHADHAADVGNGQAAAAEISADEPEEAVGQLPAFLTTGFENPQGGKPAEPVIVQNWEE